MRILIVEDRETSRSRLSALLSGQTGNQVIGAVDSVEKALIIVDKDPPDLVILDVDLPGLSGADAIKAIKSRIPSVNVLVFTLMEDGDQVFAALRAGAIGYILKDAPPLEIMESIEEIETGGAPMSRSIARKVMNEFREIHLRRAITEIVSPLSGRETQVLDRLYKGDSYKEIADKLSMSVHTVHSHIKNIYSKFHVNSRAEAIYEALQKNLIR